VSTSISGKADSNLKVGYYGDITPVQDDTVHEWRVYALDKKTGKEKWQQDRLQGGAEGQAPHEEQPRELDAGDRRRTDHRVLRVERAVRLRHERHLLWKKDLGVLDAGFYMVPRRSGRRAARRSCTTAW
jgi:hypothetical protein